MRNENKWPTQEELTDPDAAWIYLWDIAQSQRTDLIAQAVRAFMAEEPNDRQLLFFMVETWNS